MFAFVAAHQRAGDDNVLIEMFAVIAGDFGGKNNLDEGNIRESLIVDATFLFARIRTGVISTSTGIVTFSSLSGFSP